jgi:hypothetical protein
MPSWYYMLMQPYGRKGDSSPGGIPNNTWKGISPIIRGYPPTKNSSSDPLLGTSKGPISGDTWEQLLDALLASILALFPPQEPAYPKCTPNEEKRGCAEGRI